MINTPSCYPRRQQYNTCLAAPTVTGKGHRKIEPKANHFSHCKKENTATYVYIRAGSRTPTRAYVRPGLVYMAGSERRNNVVVVFMGRQRNASCSWGGNGMRRVHGEATECVMFIGRAWTEHSIETRPGIPQNGGNSLVFDRP